MVSETIVIAGIVLILIAVAGGKKIEIKEMKIGDLTNFQRIFIGLLGILVFALGIFIPFTDGGGNNNENEMTSTQTLTPTPITSSISFTSSPAGASIYFDGSHKGTTPMTITGIAEGSHTITIEHTDYQDWSKTIQVDAGKTKYVSAVLMSINGGGNGGGGEPKPTVKINEPKDGSDFPIHGESKIIGNISNVPDNQHLWIVILKTNHIYYPFPDEPVIYGDDTWQTSSYGVGEGNKEEGGVFIIGAYLLDEKAYKEIKEYVEKAAPTDAWDGMASLPEGATRYDKVEVIGTETPIVTITDPKAGDYVPWRYTVKGTSNIEPNSDLNIYVFISAWDWYAQPKAIISSNGDWETRDGCRFGNPEYSGLGYTYDICAIVTTEDFEDDEQFAKLPDYEEKSKTITVTRE